ncbi:MAG: ABC transporter ATP-binding protein, partial [Victivallales bacterium]|nr:ABC transporter ATP-binding protein [Victivallales bacterium]
LSLQPKFIVCDEPVSALDVSVQAQVLNLLMDLREAHCLSYLFISHDLSVVRLISNRVAVMYLGHIVETGSTKEVLDTPRHPYTKALLSSVPTPGGTLSKRIVLKGEQPSPLNPPSGCPFHPRCPAAEDICRRECPALRGEGRQCACWKHDTE